MEVARLIDWIAGHPDQVSVWTGGEGTGKLAWHAERERPVGSTFKVLVLASYARMVAAGRLDPARPVDLADVGRWHLAGTDEGAHERAVAAIASDGRALVLDDVVWAMIEFSDNAATDYLLALFGREPVRETARLLELDSLGGAVAPIAGTLLTLADEELGASIPERIQLLQALPAEARAAHAWRQAAAFAPESLNGLGAALRALADWDLQVELSDALPWRGSARDLAALIDRGRGASALGEEAAETVSRHLCKQADGDLANRFDRLGYKTGGSAGALAIVGFARPRTGPWRGEERTVVLLLERMDASTWQASRETYAELAADLADRPETVTRMREALGA
jgi:D-alanyl-D-alanine carboxypeptidase